MAIETERKINENFQPYKQLTTADMSSRMQEH